jgi:hypothetical protein
MDTVDRAGFIADFGAVVRRSPSLRETRTAAIS